MNSKHSIRSRLIGQSRNLTLAVKLPDWERLEAKTEEAEKPGAGTDGAEGPGAGAVGVSAKKLGAGAEGAERTGAWAVGTEKPEAGNGRAKKPAANLEARFDILAEQEEPVGELREPGELITCCCFSVSLGLCLKLITYLGRI